MGHRFPGIIVGYHKRLGYLVYYGQQFVLLAAPTRSGKGVGIVIPNLLTYPDSVVVLDLKLENFRYTSKVRAAHGQKVFLFAPFSEDGVTHRWNVFDAVMSFPPHLRIGEVMSIGEAFWPSRVEAKTKFFHDSARNLFLALSLYLMETPGLPLTLGEIFRQGSGAGRPIKQFVQEVLRTRATASAAGAALSPDCVDAFNRFLSIPDNTLGNVTATFNAPLLVFANPVVDAATSASDFDLSAVRSQRISIYFGVTPNRLDDAAQLINLFYSQLIKLNMRELPKDNPALKYQCAMFLDEAAAVGKIGIIDQSNAYIAGYNMRLVTIIQSVAQLQREDMYGKDGARTLVTNHGMQILYPPREQADAREYSEMLGYFTAVQRSRGRSTGKGVTKNNGQTEQKRALMMPQELREMPQKEEIIITENCKPIRCEKALFYKDRAFIDLLKAQSPTLAALGERMPDQDQLELAALQLRELSVPVPKIDIESMWAQRLQARAVQPEIREVTRDELALLKAEDIANADEIFEAMCGTWPFLREIKTLTESREVANHE
ncbi:type IV secretory system conjugative DNA transfer family protein [Paraburkholderia flagellata]|uniref:type IV secretory system conjugative DNA transfer family protein n=1 Tax=Paraburkholderia flagellata TaxID=2883241 RepID=UPI001F411A25|nr:type IV secretory system conjugative DNA transfer family protein [Paraburkholderia flagellata]